MRFSFADAPSGQLVKTGSLAGIAGLLAGTAAGYFLRPILERVQRRAALAAYVDSDDESNAGEDYAGFAGEDCKLVLCVRTDLKMTKGKTAAQAGHATLGAYKKARQLDPGAVARWTAGAQPKIAVAIKSAGEADRLERAARARGVTTYKVFDAGRTQIAAGSMTVIAVGPAAISDVDSVTGHLKLL